MESDTPSHQTKAELVRTVVNVIAAMANLGSLAILVTIYGDKLFK
jgi:hypothetical protein